MSPMLHIDTVCYNSSIFPPLNNSNINKMYILDIYWYKHFPTILNFRHTFEVSPAIVILENYMFKKLSSIIGYPNGEGIFCPGK